MTAFFTSAEDAREAARPMVDEVAAALGLDVHDCVYGKAAHRDGTLVVSIRAGASYSLGGLYDAVVTVVRARDYGDDGSEHLELREYRSARAAIAYVRRTVPSLRGDR